MHERFLLLVIPSWSESSLFIFKYFRLFPNAYFNGCADSVELLKIKSQEI